MSLTERTVKCPICSKPYKHYAFSAADQSACPSCANAAEREAKRGSSAEEQLRRYITKVRYE